MCTVVERTPSGGVVYKASVTRDYPRQDLLTVLFGKSLTQDNYSLKDGSRLTHNRVKLV
jgi:hypothetical protein